MTWRTGIAVVGVSFAAGALTDAGLRWRYGPPAGVRYETASNPSTASANDSGVGAPNNVEAVSRPETDTSSAVATNGVVYETSIDALRQRALALPVDGVKRRDLRDTFSDVRSGVRAHEALDIPAPRRTPVRAVEDGTIEKLFTSQAGGLTIYQFEPSGTFCYYYAHLDGYVDGLREGQAVRRRDLIGYVGSTGNASPDAPHLHFSIFRLTPERQWWKGEPIDPYPVLR
jgi:murein DD-endopeptidase MepM/ murein hydrolase activator NlpD